MDYNKYPADKFLKFSVINWKHPGWIWSVIFVVVLVSPGVLFKPVFDRKITQTILTAYPGSNVSLGKSRYNLWRNSFSSDQISFISRDSSLEINCINFRISGIKWLMVLLHKQVKDNDIVNGILIAEKVRINKKNRFFSCQNVYVSASKSDIKLDSVVIGTQVSDERYFASHRYRKTRINLLVPELYIKAPLSPEKWKNNQFMAQYIKGQNAMVEFLVNKDKDFAPGKPVTLMPNELLSIANTKIKIDSIQLNNSFISYSERFAVGGKPATVTFGKLSFSGRQISNMQPSDTAVLIFKALLFSTAPVQVELNYPLASDTFYLKFLATLGKFQVSAINPFVENAEHIRIKSGSHYHTTIRAVFVNNLASGVVSSKYENISVALIDSVSKQEGGGLKPLGSFIANFIKLKNSNMPSISGPEKNGKINYSQQEKDTFVKFIWNSVKLGIGDIVGFGKKQK